MTRLTLPDTVKGFTFSAPVGGDALASANLCRIAIADYYDDAVHQFSFGGDYVRSITGGMSDTSFARAPGAISFDSNGRLAVVSFAKQLITVVGNDRVEWQSSIKPEFGGATWANGDILLLADTLVLEHWLRARLLTSEPIQWSDPEIPLFRMHSPKGVRSSGRLVAAPGSFSPWLSRGSLSVSGDDIWFARSSDAKLFRYRIGTDEPLVLLDSLTLRRGFENGVAMEAVRPDGSTAAVDGMFHILDFSAAADGFLVLQALAYPEDGETSTRDRFKPVSTGLVFYDLDGRLMWGYRLPLVQPRQVTLQDGVAIVLARSAAETEGFGAYLVEIPERGAELCS